MATRWIFIGLVLAVYGAVVNYADPFFLFLATIWIGAPIIIISLVVLGIVAIFRRSIRAVSIPFWPAGVVVVLGLAMLPLNWGIQEWAVNDAKAYPERVAPLIEQYRREHGAYPVSFDQLPSHPFLPRLLRSSYGYRSDGINYTFTFSQPGGLIDVWHYDSESHTWNLST